MSKSYSLLVSAMAGAAVLALEVLAARVMAPFLGSGPVTWAAMLACALGMLAIGNVLGGFLCDRARPAGTIAWSLIVAVACLVGLSHGYKPAIEWTASYSLVISALLAALITQAVPLIMLGAVTPVLLGEGHGDTGRWAGFVLAAGSGGGIAGALTTGIVLIPSMGLSRSFLVIAVGLAFVAIPALWPERRWFGAIALVVCLASGAWCWQRPVGQTSIESFYGQLEVHETESGRVLLVDGLPQTGMPDQIMPGDGLRHGYLLEAALAIRPEVKRTLVIGLGAGLAPRLLAAHDVACESVEIDPVIVDIARRDFGFTGTVAIGDGRAFVALATGSYDLIVVDVCTADRLAWHLFTREAIELLRRRLAAGGLLAIQFIGDDGPWSACLSATVEAVFGRGQTVIVAPATKSGGVEPRWLFAAEGLPPRLPLELAAVRYGAPWRVLDTPSQGQILTDDHFPAEHAWARTANQWRRRYGS
ncbi:MAG: spermidine synthase [bacterium]